MDQIRKIMTMYKAINPSDYIGCMCQEKKEKGDSPTLKIASLIRKLEDYMKKNKEKLITATQSNTNINKETITRKEKW